MSNVIVPEQLTDADANWLTAALREAGALPVGRAVKLTQRANAAFNSQVAHLEVDYSADVSPDAPRALVLKLKWNHDGREEVAFYRRAENSRLSMAARCYASGYSADSGRSYLLLEDLSETHVPPVVHGDHTRLQYVPSDQDLERVVDAIARFHAAGWESPADPELCNPSSNYATREACQRWAESRRRCWQEFLAAEGDWFPDDLRALYEEALLSLDGLWEQSIAPRVASYRQLTLVNGDCYFGQFLCPRSPGGRGAVMVDLDSTCIDFGALDLVYLFATFWTPEQRHENQRERRSLEQYLRTLCASGVRNYSWEQLVNDYELMLKIMLFHPVWDETYLKPDRSYWWPKLQCLVSAYREWTGQA